MKFKEKMFSCPYSEFSDKKWSNHNPLDDVEFFLIAISFLSENEATFGGRLAQFQYWSPLTIVLFYLISIL